MPLKDDNSTVHLCAMSHYYRGRHMLAKDVIDAASMIVSEADNLSDEELQAKFEKAKGGAVGNAINNSLKAALSI